MSEKDLKHSSQTDWTRIDSLTDEEIDTSDIPPLDDDFFANATLIIPSKATQVPSDEKMLLKYAAWGEFWINFADPYPNPKDKMGAFMKHWRLGAEDNQMGKPEKSSKNTWAGIGYRFGYHTGVMLKQADDKAYKGSKQVAYEAMTWAIARLQAYGWVDVTQWPHSEAILASDADLG